MTRAMFKVQRYETSLMTPWENGKPGEPKEVRTIILMPVTGADGDEAAKFFAATPTGEIKLGTVNPEAWRQFELGKSYYVDFSPVGNE